MDNPSNCELLELTRPARLDRDLHVLEGLIQGIAADGSINEQEVDRLHEWCDQREFAASLHPFNVLIPMIRRGVADGALDLEERADLARFIATARTKNSYYDVATSDMQRLHGILLGVAADRRVSAEEVHAIRSWLKGARHLRGSWPYDQTVRLMDTVLADGSIDEREHIALLGFCGSFADEAAHLLTHVDFDEHFIRTGECDPDPAITFHGRFFCVTGESNYCDRYVIVEHVCALGGSHKTSVSGSLDYLVLCGRTSQAWAFASYGRKVEAAMKQRKAGSQICIVSEEDFWDAVEENGRQRP